MRESRNNVRRRQSTVAVDVAGCAARTLEEGRRHSGNLQCVDHAATVGVAGKGLGDTRPYHQRQSHEQHRQEYRLWMKLHEIGELCKRPGSPARHLSCLPQVRFATTLFGNFPVVLRPSAAAYGFGGVGVGGTTRTTICAVGPVFPTLSRKAKLSTVSPGGKADVPATKSQNCTVEPALIK